MKNMDLQAVGARIRSEREKLGFTREKFAEQVDVSSMYIGQIERGQRAMSLKTFIKIANCLHISTDYLIYGDIKQPTIDKSNLQALIKRCSARELKLIEEVIKLFITYVK